MDDIKPVQNELKGYLEGCSELVETITTELFNGAQKNPLDIHKTVLERKIHDVTQLQIRMTIVAPMKAGKSTIINALIGKECLPTRSDAMTMLPTEVVLKQASEDANNGPRLMLNDSNQTAICELHREIKNMLSSYATTNVDDTDFLRLFHSNVNLVKTAQEIYEKDETFIRTSKKEKESDIREILTFLNDLTRIYIMIRPAQATTRADPETEQFNSTVNATGKSVSSTADQAMDNEDILAKLGDNVPRLEVIYEPLRTGSSSKTLCRSSSLDQSEFAHLILVDTPGPNEASASIVLRNIVRQELEKADIVLVTFNYTSLNTDTDENLAKEIEAIHKIKGSHDAIYALVNKTDQRRGGDMTEDAVKKYIASQFKIPENRIFELKAIHALRARRFFAEYDQSDDSRSVFQKESALDVLREAFPSKWKKMKDKISVKDLVETAKELYEESGIDQFLEDVIETLRKQVVRRCFDSAICAYVQANSFLHTTITLRQNGLQLDAEKLNQESLSLEKDMLDLSKLKKTYSERKSTILSEFQTKLEKILQTHTMQTSSRIEVLFDENSARWKDPSMWRDMVREQRFAAGTFVGAISTGAAIGAGITFGAPVAAAAAIVGAATFVGLQTGAHFAEDHQQTVKDTSSKAESSENRLLYMMKSIPQLMARVYAVVFTKDEARFETAKAATEFIDNVKIAANNISQDYYDTISSEVDQLCESISNKLFLELNEESSAIIEKTNERFNGMFQITRIVPAKFRLQIENVMSLKISPIARYRPMFGFWPFEFDATDDATRQRATKHCVHRQELKENCLKIVQKNMSTIKQNIIERVQKAMQEQLEFQFKKLQDDLQMYLDEVKRSMNDKRKTAENQQEFSLKLKELLKRVEDDEKKFNHFKSIVKQKWINEEEKQRLEHEEGGVCQ